MRGGVAKIVSQAGVLRKGHQRDAAAGDARRSGCLSAEEALKWARPPTKAHFVRVG